MSLRNVDLASARSNHPLVTEFALLTAVLVCAYLWDRLLRSVLTTVVEAPQAPGGLLVGGLVYGGLLVGGLILLVGAYAVARDVDVGLELPDRSALPTVALAVLAPPALVAGTDLVAVATGVPYTSLTKTSVAGDASVVPVAAVTGLALLTTVPALVALCQVLVQGSLQRVVGADAAVGLTTLVSGFLLVDTTGRLAPVPDGGKLAGTLVFVALLAVALYGRERAERDWLGYLAAVPVAAFVALVALSGLAQVASVAAGLFAATQLATFAVAAYGYDRSGSLVPPALAYASLLVATRLAVVIEAGAVL